MIGTMTGRNFGWVPAEYAQALAHIARVIREDDGSGQLAADRLDGLSYAVIFKGTDSRITSDMRLPASERLDVRRQATCRFVNEVALCITTYMKDLLFQRDVFGRYIGSPYDNFLRVNHLPQAPLAGETKAAYNQRLYQQVVALTNPIYITPADGSFKYHNQPFRFGPLELQGLKIFLAARRGGTDGAAGGQLRGVSPGAGFLGLCVSQQWRVAGGVRRGQWALGRSCSWRFRRMRAAGELRCVYAGLGESSQCDGGVSSRGGCRVTAVCRPGDVEHLSESGCAAIRRQI